MISEGLMMLSIGMGTVFIYFFVMIFVVNLLAKFVAALNKRFPEASAPSSSSGPALTAKPAVSDAVAVAIAAAARYSKGAK